MILICSLMFLKSSLQTDVDMRTKWQLIQLEVLMFTDLKDALKRSHSTMVADTAGLLSLIAMFVMGMNLTNLF